MTSLPLDTWLSHYQSRPHPKAYRYSALTAAQLWRLHAVDAGKVFGIAGTDASATADFVGVTVDALVAHRERVEASQPAASASKPDAELTRRWLALRGRLWASLTVPFVDDDFDQYEADVRALLNRLEVQLLSAVDALDGVAPALLTVHDGAPDREERLASDVEQGLVALVSAQDALTALRRRMLL